MDSVKAAGNKDENRYRGWTWKKSLSVLLSCMLASLCFIGFHNVFRFKSSDGILGLEKMYQQAPGSIDVLFLGSSHAFININPAVLYSEYGVAAYVLGGSIQPFWSTYYYLDEALKTQRPKLIVLEAYGAVFPNDYSGPSVTIKNNYGLPLSKNYIESMQVSAPPDQLFEYLFQINQYHGRYTELAKADFVPNQNRKLYEDFKGCGWSWTSKPLEREDVSNISETQPMKEKNQEYYIKIIELCNEYNIPLEILVTPFKISDEQQRIMNSAQSIATSYGIPFTDYNLDFNRTKIDLKTEYADVAHLNVPGSTRLTKLIYNDVIDKHSLPDRRTNEAWQSWERNAQFFKADVKNHEIAKITDFDKYVTTLATLPDDQYTIVLGLNDLENVSDIKSSLAKLGIVDHDNSIWLINGAEALRLSNVSNPYIKISNNIIDYSNSNSLILNNKKYEFKSDSVCILIYNQYTDTLADWVVIKGENVAMTRS